MNIFSAGRRIALVILIAYNLFLLFAFIQDEYFLWNEYLIGVGIGLFLIVSLTFAIGWITRGLMDIPNGEDKKK